MLIGGFNAIRTSGKCEPVERAKGIERKREREREREREKGRENARGERAEQ